MPEIQSNLEPDGAVWEVKVTHIYSSYCGFTVLLKSILIVMTEGIKLVKYSCVSAKIFTFVQISKLGSLQSETCFCNLLTY